MLRRRIVYRLITKEKPTDEAYAGLLAAAKKMVKVAVYKTLAVAALAEAVAKVEEAKRC